MTYFEKVLIVIMIVALIILALFVRSSIKKVEKAGGILQVLISAEEGFIELHKEMKKLR